MAEREEEDRFVRVGTLAEVPEGEMRAYDLDFGRLALANVDGRILAFGDDCTHMACSLAEGDLEDGTTVVCACHGSVFDLETGEPAEGPAVDPIPVYRVRVEDGWVEVARP